MAVSGGVSLSVLMSACVWTGAHGPTVDQQTDGVRQPAAAAGLQGFSHRGSGRVSALSDMGYLRELIVKQLFTQEVLIAYTIEISHAHPHTH